MLKGGILAKSLRDYALAAEIIGAIAVVVSLIFVGLSVNQNTRAVMVANHQALVAMDQDTTNWFQDPAFAATWEIARTDVDGLSPIEWRQVFSYTAGKFNAWEFAFLTHDSGMMADNIWDGWNAHYRTVLIDPIGERFWSLERESFSPAFRRYVDAILSDAE